MRIAGAGSAFPRHLYNQQQISEALIHLCKDQIGKPETVRRLHARCGVERRHLALPLEAYGKLQNWGQANDLWIEHAQSLGRTAVCRAISPAGFAPSQIHALYFVSVTGIASPSIDARLVNRMGLSPNIKRNPIFGLGCVAGAAGLARAADYLRGFPEHIAVVLSVELCSLTWQRQDLSYANLIASGLFGDGAAAVVLTGSALEGDGPEIVATRSVFYPDTEYVMGWDISQTGFELVLSPDVPDVVRKNLPRDVDAFLAEQELDRKDISSWIIHTGGPKVLDAVSDSLDLPDGALDLSWECLRTVGNLSSASVLLVLQDFLRRRRGNPGEYSLLAAMGPGFCSELVLLRW